MNKFIFKLQGVLDIRRDLEEQAKAEFGLAQAELVAEEKKLEAIIARKEAQILELKELMSSNLNVKKINLTKEGVEVLKEMEKEQALVVSRVETKVELARRKLQKAILERKTIEKLREKQLEEYKVMYEAEEQKINDEMSSYSYSEKQKTPKA
ncbi:MAG: flagellar export protein FliJ [Lachnospiraceae bacterium]|nr:flagellar export protein FliJ [Lachnospiraceae bacterium]